MLSTLIKRGRGRPPKDGISKDFKSFASNLLASGALFGIQYPCHLKRDLGDLTTRYQFEWGSFTINYVFERCVERFKAMTGRPIAQAEAYYLVKEVADFVDEMRPE